MPPAKNPRKSAKSAKNQYSAELSPGQLAIGIAILMIFGLACFLFGVLVGKFDPSISDRVVKVADSEQVASLETEPVSTEPATSRPPETTTKPVETSPAPAKIEPASKPPIEEKKMTVTKAPADPPTKPTTPATSIPESATVTTTDLPPVEPTKPTAGETPKAEPPKIEVPEGTPVGNAEIVTAQATDEPAKVEEPVAPTRPTKPSSPMWTVQLAAFGSKKNAEVEKARLEKLMPYKLELYQSSDSSLTMVQAGRYATKAEADVFKEQLAQRYQVKGFTAERK